MNRTTVATLRSCRLQWASTRIYVYCWWPPRLHPALVQADLTKENEFGRRADVMAAKLGAEDIAKLLKDSGAYADVEASGGKDKSAEVADLVAAAMAAKKDKK